MRRMHSYGRQTRAEHCTGVGVRRCACPSSDYCLTGVAVPRRTSCWKTCRRPAPMAQARAPITIYRALHFLMEQGLVRRVATTSTFMACGDIDGQHEVFMVRKRCGLVSVVHD